MSVHVLSHSETVNISDRAIDEIPSQIVEAQTWDVDAVSSATFTSDAIREAVERLPRAGGTPMNHLRCKGYFAVVEWVR